MNACKALLIALCLSLPAGAADDVAQALPLPAAPRWLHKSANGSLVIKSATRGAQVAVDGRAVGTVPLAPLPVAPGRHQIKLSRKGFVSVTRRVQVVAGQKSLLSIDLLAEVAPLPLPPAAEAAPSPSDALTALITAPAGAAPAVAGGPSAATAGAPSSTSAARDPAATSAAAGGAALAAGPAAGAAAVEPVPLPPLVLAPAGVALAPAAVAPGAKAPQAALAPAVSQPLTKKWWFWSGAAVGAVVLAAAVTWALPALYVEHRDPAAACGGTCGIVVNK